ncbi:MAG: MgtC/SapB family protein [Candidatus Gastranaerophilales bacterium]|nr:MgtC/SapB family protein [Candidatus Gastranaerophilales bacterium]
MPDFQSIFLVLDGDIIFRVLLSAVLGFVIGLEREITNKSAGLRTNILVCIGSCLFTILSIYGFSNALSIYPMGDPARVAAQILTGIGFIGGGTVLRHGTSIFGLTTAAALWVTASVGMACGCGKYSLAILCALISVATLTLIRIFEKNCIPKNTKNNKILRVSLVVADEDFQKVSDIIMQNFPEVEEFSKKDAGAEENQTKISFKVTVCCKNAVDFAFNQFKNETNILAISVKELNE